MTEENKAIARRLYEIISTGDFGRATEIVDQDAPDNELLSYDPPAKLIDTFKETFAEARVTMHGTDRGEFQGIAPTGKRVEVRAIDMFRISDGKIVEHWGHADDPTGFLRQSQCF
jgi:ketosteroid isomerase-like protein